MSSTSGFGDGLVVVVLPDPFRGMGAWKNSTETQQSGHALRSEPEVGKSVIVAAKSGQFTADETGKGQFFRGNRRNLVGEGGVIPAVLRIFRYFPIVVILLSFVQFQYYKFSMITADTIYTPGSTWPT